MSDIEYTYYFCEPCGNEWKNKSEFVQRCPKCKSDNTYISELNDTQPDDISKQ